MRVRFLRDFQGVNTGEVFYRAGDEADLDTWAALAEEGVIAIVEPEPTPAPEPPPAPVDSVRPRGRRA